MASEHNAQANMQAHERTYSSFISIVKSATVVVAIVAAIVIFLIAH